MSSKGDSKKRRRLRRLASLMVLLLGVSAAVAAGGTDKMQGPNLSSQNEPEAPLPPPPTSVPSQPRENTLVLPQLSGPQLSPPPPVLESPQIPSPFIGCWDGDPRRFDYVATDAGLVDIGSPGEITFCYTENTFLVPEAEVRINPSARVLDWLVHFGLGYSTFKAHGIDTDIYRVTARQIYGRSNLVIDLTDHWLYLIPSHTQEPSQVDVVATLVGPNTMLVQANQVIFLENLKMWGTWHGFFHRTNK